MASVQELLLAAQAQKSPFISLLEGVASGYRDSQLKALDDQKKMQDIAQQKQQMQFTKMVQDAYEKTLKGELANASAPVEGSFPQQKLDSVINLGSRGANIKISTPQQYGPRRTPSLQRTQYQDSNGRRRIGSFDPTSGQTIQSENDAFAPMPATKPASGGTGSPSRMAAVNKNALAQATHWYTNAHPEKAVVDPFSGKVVDNKLSEEDSKSDEFQQYFRTALEQLSSGPNAGGGQPQNQPAAKTPASQPQGRDQEVERVTKDGKRAIFNARTRQFIRWK